jgi:hypothetical protein
MVIIPLEGVSRLLFRERVSEELILEQRFSGRE